MYQTTSKFIKLPNNWTAMNYYTSLVALFVYGVYAGNWQRTESIYINTENNACATTVPLEKYPDGEIVFRYNQSILLDKRNICWLVFEAPEHTVVQYNFHGLLPVIDCTKYTRFCANACASDISVEDDSPYTYQLCIKSLSSVELNKTRNSLFISFKLDETPINFTLSFYILQQEQNQHDQNDEITCSKNICTKRVSEYSNTYKVCGSVLDVCSDSDSEILNNTNSIIAVSISSGVFILILAIALLNVIRHRFMDTTKQSINRIVIDEEYVSSAGHALENQSLDLPPHYSTLELADQSQNQLEHVLNKSLPTYDNVVSNPEQYSVGLASIY